MESLRAMMLFMALSSAVLATTFLYVWHSFVRRGYVICWSLAWAVAVPQLLCQFQALDPQAAAGYSTACQVFTVLNALLMLLGCFHFVHRRFPAVWLLAVAVPALFGAVMGLQVPGTVLLGTGYLWASTLFVRFSRERGIRGSRLVGILFAVAGLHEFDYPLLQHLPYYNTAGYMLAAALAITISFCLLVTFLEELRSDADRERAQMRDILNHLPVGVLVADPNGDVLLTNAAADGLLPADFARKAGTVRGLEASIFSPPNGAGPDDAPSPLTLALVATEAAPAREFNLRSAAGEPAVTVLVNSGAVRDERGKLTAGVLVLDDIAELKQMQSEVARNERLQSLGTLAAGVAHDFNNALTMILGHAELATADCEKESVREQLATITAVARDSAAIVNRIQDLARTRVLHGDVVFDLTRVVREVIEMSRPRWRDQSQAAGIEYTVVTDLTEGLSIEGTPSEVREALLNLVLNALDAMPTGGRLELGVRRSGADAELWVRDSGGGIPAAARDRVFDPFFTTKGQRGTGLGLSIVYGIVQRHGGNISLESSPEAGTRFVIRLPLATSSPTPTPTPTPTTENVATAAPAMRLLVVDDEPLVRSLTATMLGLSGHLVATAEDGLLALDLVRSQPFDLVLTDLGMPGMNGWQLAEAIHLIAPGLPIVLVTGWGQTVSSEQAETHGVASVLPKPFTRKQLLACLAEATHGRALAGVGAA